MAKFEYQDKGHLYLLNGKPLMGCTTVLGIVSKPKLIGWAARMTADWIRENCEKDTVKIGEGYNRYHVTDDQLQEAVKAHTKRKDQGAKGGKELHARVEEYVLECIRESGGKVMDGDTSLDDGLRSFIEWAREKDIKFIASEKRMYSEEWWCAGTADLIFERGGKTFIGDVKTQAKMWDRIPFIQMAAYAKMYEETEKKKIDGTCVILIPQENPKVEAFWEYNHEADIKAFESALVLYKSVPLE